MFLILGILLGCTAFALFCLIGFANGMSDAPDDSDERVSQLPSAAVFVLAVVCIVLHYWLRHKAIYF